MKLQAGDQLGPYRILEQRGAGGMANVYKALDPALERVVALKILRPSLADDASLRERFLREAKTIARLDHPHIVTMFSHDEADGLAFIAMEFIDGITLKERLSTSRARGARLPRTEIARVVSDAASALTYAHEHGVVHRDVKPSNLIIDSDGQTIVTDFGIAKILASADPQSTQTGLTLGTPDYMAPEQLRGHADALSDQYALAVVAFEALTGRVPFTADTPFAVALAHVQDPLPLPSSIDTSIDPRTERVLLKALAKDPASRYPSATEFATALAASLESEETIQTSPIGAIAARVQHPRLMLLGVALLTVLVTSGVLLLNTPVVSSSASTASPSAPVATSASTPAQVAALSLSPTPTLTAAPTLPPSAAPTPAPTATVPPAPTATVPPQAVAPPTFNPQGPRFVMSGRVTGAVSGGPIGTVVVHVFNDAAGEVATADAGADGRWSVSVPNAVYHVQVYPLPSTGYAVQWWPSGIAQGSASDITVNGSNVGNVNSVVVTGFRVTGQFRTNAGVPITDAAVCPSVDGSYVGGAAVDPSGTYEWRLPNGTYQIEFTRDRARGCGHSPDAVVPVTVNGRDVSVSATAP